MPSLKDMKSWRDRLGHSGLRSFTDAEGHLWVEQNAANGAPLFFKNGLSRRPACSGVPASKIGKRPSTVPNKVKVMLAFTL